MSNRRDECNRIEDEIINGQTMINLSVDLNTNTHTQKGSKLNRCIWKGQDKHN